uniref:C-type lectin domain-containing protein n=1 Tax=Haplochromis burtoni TaxID=8153 RepID=A0A3Q2VWU0_HAPBU
MLNTVQVSSAASTDKPGNRQSQYFGPLVSSLQAPAVSVLIDFPTLPPVSVTLNSIIIINIAVCYFLEHNFEGSVLLSFAACYIQQGWIYFKHSLYYVSSTKNTWNDSREDCLQRGADLVIINSREEQNFIREFKKRTWIGLTDTEKEQTWKWVDGTTPTISLIVDEDCGEIYFYERENSWNDTPCDTKKVWICERKM